MRFFEGVMNHHELEGKHIRSQSDGICRYGVQWSLGPPNMEMEETDGPRWAGAVMRGGTSRWLGLAPTPF